MPPHVEYPVYRDHYGIFPLNKLADFGAGKYGNATFVRTWNGKSYDEITFTDYARFVNSCARWIVEEGIRKGDKVALLGDDGPRWGITYLGIHGAGAVVVPVDRLMPPSQMKHVIADSGAKLLFTSSKYLEMLSGEFALDSDIQIVSFDLSNGTGFCHFDDVLKKGAERFTKLPEVDMDDLAAILYTSGTTGTSKGVMLTNRNIMSNVTATMQMTTLGTEDIFLSLMPMHHSYQCTNGFLHPLYIGSSITYARRLRSKEIIEDIQQSNVTVMGAVPLLFEKIRAGIERKAKDKGIIASTMFKVMMQISSFGEKIGVDIGFYLFKGLRTKGGMGSMKYFITGGAPIDPTTSKFFNNFGIKTLQGFGITEASPLTHFTPPSKIRHECVGLPIPDLISKINDPNDDGIGELYVKGPNIFKGYFKNEEATREAFTDDGWFKTGDLGKIHKDGYLQITGRKKNLIVTSGGKNIYPEEIEFYLKKSEFIEECIVLGAKNKGEYSEEVGAIIYPDKDVLKEHLEQNYDEISESAINEIIKTELKKTTEELPPYKQVKKFKIIDEEFQKTSTRKIKRYLYDGYLDKK